MGDKTMQDISPNIPPKGDSRYMTFKEVCGALKCSRTWMNGNIKNHLSAVRVKKTGGSYLMASDTVLFDAVSFNDFIRSRITSCQKRSKAVYRSALINQQFLMHWRVNAGIAWINDYDNRGRQVRRSWYGNEWIGDTTDIDTAKALYDSRVFESKRSEAKWIDVPVPITPIIEWRAAHDELEYGDADETIYRRFFRDGCIRLELTFSDKCKRVYYVNDPDPVLPSPISDERQKELYMGILNATGAEKSRALVASTAWQQADAFNVQETAWQKWGAQLLENAKRMQ